MEKEEKANLTKEDIIMVDGKILTICLHLQEVCCPHKVMNYKVGIKILEVLIIILLRQLNQSKSFIHHILHIQAIHPQLIRLVIIIRLAQVFHPIKEVNTLPDSQIWEFRPNQIRVLILTFQCIFHLIMDIININLVLKDTLGSSLPLSLQHNTVHLVNLRWSRQVLNTVVMVQVFQVIYHLMHNTKNSKREKVSVEDEKEWKKLKNLKTCLT